MDSEFPSNSRKPIASKDKTEPKIVEKVISGEVVRRKKSLGKRVSDHFGGANAKGVFGFVTLEVLLPAAKDAVADAVSQGVERMIFGEARSTSRRTGMRPGNGGRNGFVNYTRFSPNTPRDGRREEPHNSISRRARANHDFDEIILPTKVEAEEVIDGLFELVSKYDMATVSELYSLVGISGDFTDEKYGWTDLRGAGSSRVRGGYLLDLPKPEYLD